MAGVGWNAVERGSVKHKLKYQTWPATLMPDNWAGLSTSYSLS